MRRIILIGFMGAGKTTVGNAYAKKLGVELVDTDQRIEALAGMSIPEIFSCKGEEAFRRLETAVLDRLAGETDAAVISAGGGLPMREENRTLLKKIGAVVYLDVARETVLCRLAGDTTRPLLWADGKEDGNDRIDCLLSQRDPIYRSIADLVIDVNEKSPDEIVDEIEEGVKHLKKAK